MINGAKSDLILCVANSESHGEDFGTQLANLVRRFDLTLEPMAICQRSCWYYHHQVRGTSFA